MTRLAERLWNARRTGGVVDAEPGELPKSKEDAYAIQQEIVALSGHACIGYKVGSTSVEAQRLLGTDEPGSGVLLAPYVHESPARIVITPTQTPGSGGRVRLQFFDLRSHRVAMTINVASQVRQALTLEPVLIWVR